MSSPLLTHHTPLERALDALTGETVNVISVPVRAMSSPESCPDELLAWLAWGRHVDNWEMCRTTDTQRALIRDSIKLHREKGTKKSVRNAIVSAGIDSVRIVSRPAGAHWAEFDVDITVSDRPLTENLYGIIVDAVYENKPARSNLRNLIVSGASRGTFNAACVLFAGDIVTVQPYQITEITTPSMQPSVGIGRHDWGTTTIYPRTP